MLLCSSAAGTSSSADDESSCKGSDSSTPLNTVLATPLADPGSRLARRSQDEGGHLPFLQPCWRRRRHPWRSGTGGSFWGWDTPEQGSCGQRIPVGRACSQNLQGGEGHSMRAGGQEGCKTGHAQRGDIRQRRNAPRGPLLPRPLQAGAAGRSRDLGSPDPWEPGTGISGQQKAHP